MEVQDETSIRKRAKSVYQHGLGATFLAKRAAETAYRGYAILTEFGTLAKAPRNIFQSLVYPDSLPQQSFGEFLEFMHSTFQGEEELRAGEEQTLWSLIINVRDEQRDRSNKDPGRAQYVSTRELVIVYLERIWSGVWAARSPAAMEVRFGWLAAVLNLDENGVLPYSFPKTGGGMLLTGRGAETQTGHNHFAVRDGESPGYFFTGTGEVSPHLYVTPESHLYVYCSGARKKLWREVFVTEEADSPPTSVFVNHGYVQHAGSEWRGEHCIRYPSYLIPEKHELPDAIACVYGDSTALGLKQAVVSLQGGLDQQDDDSEGDVVIGSGSNNGSDSKGSGRELSAFMLEMRNFLKDD